MAENKPDQEFDIAGTLSKTEHFVNQNKKSLSIIVGAVVLAVGGYLFYENSYVAGKEKEAEGQLHHRRRDGKIPRDGRQRRQVKIDRQRAKGGERAEQQDFTAGGDAGDAGGSGVHGATPHR